MDTKMLFEIGKVLTDTLPYIKKFSYNKNSNTLELLTDDGKVFHLSVFPDEFDLDFHR